MLLYQADYHKATLTQFQAHLKKELVGCCPERVINAASYCFEQWLKAREMNSKRLQVNSELRASNERLRKAKPEHGSVEALHAKLISARKEIKQLETFRDEVLAANEELGEEVDRLEEECEEWAESQKYWREDAHTQGMAYSSLAFKYDTLADEKEELRAENQRLKQQLAARTVSTDFYPGQFITYYPN